MKPLDFRVKRIRRTYFWTAWLICNIITSGVVWLLIGYYPNYDPHVMNMLIGGVIALTFIYLSLLTVKRFHDVGRGTGYFIFCLLLVPIGIGDVLILLEALKDSDVDNQWGVNEERLLFEKNSDYYRR